MFSMIPAEAQEPMFLIREGKHRFPLTSGQVNRLLKKWTKETDMGEMNFSSHAVKRGGLNWAHNSNLTGETLQVLGCWASDAYKRYVDVNFNRRVQASHHMMKYANDRLLNK